VWLHTDADGALTIRLAGLDAEVRAGQQGPLHAFARIEIGRGGWAGVLDLVKLREIRGSWHLGWVARGWGVAGLFVALDPEGLRGDGRALAAEASLARQEADYLAVASGALPPHAFLERYPHSPFRRSVESMARAIAVR
jgi:hypothetical protein